MRRNGINEVDVAVLGGGPAGTATALGLAHRGHSAVVIERSDYRNVRVGESLAPAVAPLLRSLGVWDRFLREDHAPSFGIRSAWGRDELYDNDFIYNPYGCGWHVDRTRFDAMLAAAAEQGGAEVIRGAKVLFCEEKKTGNWQIQITCARQQRWFRARRLIDATGRASVLARARGAKRITHDRLVGIVAFYSPTSREAVPAASTLVEAVEDGWLYSAVLADQRLVIAYMTDADLYARGCKISASYWQNQLERTRHTRLRTDGCKLQTGPLILAANSSCLDHACGRNWLAVGDAAAAFDPLSSQGVYHALKSGLAAAEAINRHLGGKRTALTAYALEVQRNFAKYLLARQRYYNREARWPDSLFWQRRH